MSNMVITVVYYVIILKISKKKRERHFLEKSFNMSHSGDDLRKLHIAENAQ